MAGSLYWNEVVSWGLFSDWIRGIEYQRESSIPRFIWIREFLFFRLFTALSFAHSSYPSNHKGIPHPSAG
jgi:hypothetical protein